MDKQFDEIEVFVLNELVNNEVFITARELGEKLDITSQKASGALKRLENSGMITSKKVKAGRNELKCYFMPRVVMQGIDDYYSDKAEGKV